MRFLRCCRPRLSYNLRFNSIRSSSASAPHPLWVASGTGRDRGGPFVKISDEVSTALKEKEPVVALESAVYTHGFPAPENFALAKKMEEVVRDNGAIPATIGVFEGQGVVGLSSKQLEELTASAGSPNTLKVSRRDLPFVLGVPHTSTGSPFLGGTTVSATALLAWKTGIKVLATGGLGGVHRGVDGTMDISADLIELGRTPIGVVSSGFKAFLDLEKSLEVLETQGVYVGTFGSRSAEEPVQFPAFYSRGCGIASPSVVETPEEAAATIYVTNRMRLTCGQLFANPIPAEYEIPHEEISSIMEEAVRDAAGQAKGKDITPFILKNILQRTEGRSAVANRALLLDNAAMGAKVAVALSKIIRSGNA